MNEEGGATREKYGAGQGGAAGPRGGGDGAEAADAVGRRRFVAICAGGTCAIAASVAIPGVVFVAAPLAVRAANARRFVVARLEDLEPNTPKKVSVVGDETDAWTRAPQRRLGAVWLTRTADRTVRALSVICPHLGCVVDLAADGRGFGCPCHESSFSLEGTRVGGPSPRAMDELPTEITPAGEVAIELKHFRIGIATKEEIG